MRARHIRTRAMPRPSRQRVTSEELPERNLLPGRRPATPHGERVLAPSSHLLGAFRACHAASCGRDRRDAVYRV